MSSIFDITTLNTAGTGVIPSGTNSVGITISQTLSNFDVKLVNLTNSATLTFATTPSGTSIVEVTESYGTLQANLPGNVPNNSPDFVIVDYYDTNNSAVSVARQLFSVSNVNGSVFSCPGPSSLGVGTYNAVLTFCYYSTDTATPPNPITLAYQTNATYISNSSIQETIDFAYAVLTYNTEYTQ